MKRFFVIYLSLLFLGAILWPALRGIGLFRIPGDLVLSFEGLQIGAPFATSCVIAFTVVGVWRLLEP